MLAFNKSQRPDAGDTLIEVLFALTVFSMIVVTSLSLMNQGVAASQRSLETTLVRQQMDGQAETLRFLHESYVQAYQSGQTYNLTDTATSPAEEYYKIIKHVEKGENEKASPFGGTAPCKVPYDRSKDFIVNSVSAKLIANPDIFAKAPTFSQLVYSGNTVQSSQGLWIEGVRSRDRGTTAGYIDFHIRACWDVLGSEIPMNLGTIVRLYEPRT